MMARTLAFALAATLVLSGRGYSLSFNGIRMAHYQLAATTDAIPTGLMIRAKAAGYNYILIEYAIEAHASEWSNGKYIGTGGTAPDFTGPMRTGLKNAFLAANKYKLRLVPEFQTGSPHSGAHWQKINSQIHYEYYSYGTSNALISAVPVYAPDANGLDLSFSELMRVVKNAFNDAKLTYSLEYIHLGHDEAYCMSPKCSTVMPMIGQSTLDQSWISTHPATTANTSIQLLMADEIKRRIRAVHVFLPKTKVIIAGDMWDPEFFGGLCNTANVITTPTAQSSVVKDSLILMPWACDSIKPSPPYAPHLNYNSTAAFEHFRKNGFKFILGMCLFDADVAYDMNSRLYQASEYMVTASRPIYRKSNVGYVSLNWNGGTSGWNSSKGIYDQMRCFRTLEHVSHIMYRNIPATN